MAWFNRIILPGQQTAPCHETAEFKTVSSLLSPAESIKPLQKAYSIKPLSTQTDTLFWRAIRAFHLYFPRVRNKTIVFININLIKQVFVYEMTVTL